MRASPSLSIQERWRILELRAVGRIVTGSTPPKAQADLYGEAIPFVKPSDLRNGPVTAGTDSLSEKGAAVADIAPPGSTLVSCIGILGKAGLTAQSVAFNQQINAIIPENSESSKWVFYAIQTPAFADQLAAVASATTISIVNKSKFSSLKIPWAPEAEQRRIVAEIEKQFTRLDAGVAALRRVQANLKRYRASVLKAACEGRLVPTEAELARQSGRPYETGADLLARILTERRTKWSGRGKYREPTSSDAGELELPKGWIRATAEQLTDENRSITYGVIKLGEHIPDGVPVLRSSDVRHLRLDLVDVKRVSPRIAGDYRRTFLQGGEVLVTVRGTLGGVVVAPSECSGFNISREVAMLAMVEPQVARAAALFIGSFDLQRWLLKRAKGIAYTGINIETLKALPIPLPPLAEQHRIVAEADRRLSVLDELEALVSANLQRATRLRQSILQRAFAGELV